jgi:hypothetical protein
MLTTPVQPGLGTRTRVTLVFLLPPLKFRTAGFPQYGFKRDFCRDLHPVRRGLSARPAYPRAGSPYTRLKSRPPVPMALAGMYVGTRSQDAPVHRPLARQRVLLSHRVVAYYGLIRASRPHPPVYVLDGGSSPFGPVRAGNERFPNLLCLSVFSVPPSLPRQTGRLPLAITSSPTLAFPQFAQGRHLLCHALRSRHGLRSRGCKVRLMLRPGEIASPAPARAFTFELSPPKSPPGGVEYNYAGK